MTTIAERLSLIQQVIKETCANRANKNHEVRLIGVSKGQSPIAIKEAFAAGLREFGENYWQEAQQKQLALQQLAITWHFLGTLQRNKAAKIAAHFDWIHSLDDEKIIPLLAKYRPPHLAPLNLCIQVNLDNEINKSGVFPEKIVALATLINEFPTLKLRGLMAIPMPQSTQKNQYDSFYRLTQLLQSTNQQLQSNLDTLSMGMSDDMQAAILAGSTMVRIGRAIFGERS